MAKQPLECQQKNGDSHTDNKKVEQVGKRKGDLDQEPHIEPSHTQETKEKKEEKATARETKTRKEQGQTQKQVEPQDNAETQK